VTNEIAIVIPALNEEASISGTLVHLAHILPNSSLVVVDGNSSDRTAQIARELGAKVMLQDGRGKGVALRQAFESSSLHADYIVIMDADRSMRPEEVPQFVKTLEDGADLVKGSRFMPGGHSDDIGLVRRIGNRLFVWLVNRVWSTKYTDLCYGFLAFRAGAIEKLCPHLRSSGFEIETEICIKAAKLGLRVAEVPSTELRRHSGMSHLSAFRDGFRILTTIAKESLEGDIGILRDDASRFVIAVLQCACDGVDQASLTSDKTTSRSS
jgi:glycosyltransferase involved in cell wall biosynthesis